MNGLPENVQLGFLVGQELIQVCAGRHEIQLHFDGGASISAEGVIVYVDSAGAETRFDRPSPATPVLLELLNQTIEAARGTSDGTLHLRFEGGECLNVYDSNESYESYTIRHQGGIIVV
jgi:hypothetical protein